MSRYVKSFKSSETLFIKQQYNKNNISLETLARFYGTSKANIRRVLLNETVYNPATGLWDAKPKEKPVRPTFTFLTVFNTYHGKFLTAPKNIKRCGEYCDQIADADRFPDTDAGLETAKLQCIDMSDTVTRMETRVKEYIKK